MMTTDDTALRDRVARAIRDAVRLRYGPNAREILEQGGEVCLNYGEADTAAEAALAIVQPVLAARDVAVREATASERDRQRSQCIDDLRAYASRNIHHLDKATFDAVLLAARILEGSATPADDPAASSKPAKEGE